jgi:hypothetical protein
LRVLRNVPRIAYHKVYYFLSEYNSQLLTLRCRHSSLSQTTLVFLLC